MPIILNQDREFVTAMRRALQENDGYCPCALIKSEDTRCMCREFRENGICHCGLYTKIAEPSPADQFDHA